MKGQFDVEYLKNSLLWGFFVDEDYEDEGEDFMFGVGYIQPSLFEEDKFNVGCAFNPYFRGRFAKDILKEWMDKVGTNYSVLKAEAAPGHKACHIFAKWLGFNIIWEDDKAVYLERVNNEFFARKSA